MLFFQAVLLLGYLYAHWLHEKLAPRKQAFLHIAVLAASLATLPILPNPEWKTAAVAHPSERILLLLALTVGLPVRVEIPQQKHRLEEKHAGGPHRGSAAEPRQNRLGDDGLDFKQQERRKRNRERVEQHLRNR